MQFPTEKLILLRGGIPPIIGAKIYYFKSRFFKKRAFAPPVVAPLEKQNQRPIAQQIFRDLTEEEASGCYLIQPDDIRSEDCPSFFADLLTLDRDGNASIIIEEGDEHG